ISSKCIMRRSSAFLILAGLCAFVLAIVVLPNTQPQTAQSSLAATASAVVPTISTQPVSQDIPLGGQFNVHVDVTSPTPVTYTWYRNGTKIDRWNYAMWYVAEATVAEDA